MSDNTSRDKNLPRGKSASAMPFVTLKTDELLLKRLDEAAKRLLSKEELRRQRVSFIFGNLPFGSPITRQQVEAALARGEGETIEA